MISQLLSQFRKWKGGKKSSLTGNKPVYTLGVAGGRGAGKTSYLYSLLYFFSRQQSEGLSEVDRQVFEQLGVNRKHMIHMAPPSQDFDAATSIACKCFNVNPPLFPPATDDGFDFTQRVDLFNKKGVCT